MADARRDRQRPGGAAPLDPEPMGCADPRRKNRRSVGGSNMIMVGRADRWHAVIILPPAHRRRRGRCLEFAFYFALSGLPPGATHENNDAGSLLHRPTRLDSLSTAPNSGQTTPSLIHDETGLLALCLEPAGERKRKKRYTALRTPATDFQARILRGAIECAPRFTVPSSSCRRKSLNRRADSSSAAPAAVLRANSDVAGRFVCGCPQTRTPARRFPSKPLDRRKFP